MLLSETKQFKGALTKILALFNLHTFSGFNDIMFKYQV